MKIIGIVGSRRRTGADVVRMVESRFLDLYEEDDRLVSGGCPVGADRIAELLATKHQTPITIHYARWAKHGKAAGFIRNKDIAHDADVLVAAVASDRKGGTEDTIKHFLRKFNLTEAQAIKDNKLILV